MGTTGLLRTTMRWSAATVGFFAGGYAAYVGVTWAGYGHPRPAGGESADPLLDRFMPDYEVAERHSIQVAAPADITLAAACDADLMQSLIIRTIFRTRELILGSEPDRTAHPRGVLAFTKSIGWMALAELPDREIVMGTVTQPWNETVTFRPLTPDEFVTFNQPGYVKIAWTLRADPVGPTGSIFRHETRVATTDAAARAKFRRYWSCFSPGMMLIRWLLLSSVRTEAERRAGRSVSVQSA